MRVRYPLDISFFFWVGCLVLSIYHGIYHVISVTLTQNTILFSLCAIFHIHDD